MLALPPTYALVLVNLTHCFDRERPTEWKAEIANLLELGADFPLALLKPSGRHVERTRPLWPAFDIGPRPPDCFRRQVAKSLGGDCERPNSGVGNAQASQRSSHRQLIYSRCRFRHVCTSNYAWQRLLGYGLPTMVDFPKCRTYKGHPLSIVGTRGALQVNLGPESSRCMAKSPPLRKTRRLRIPWTALVIVAAAAGSWYTINRSTAPIEVTTAQAEVVELEAGFTAEGFVKGKEHRLSPELSARIASLSVREGDAVVKGQVLLRLNGADLQAALNEAIASRTQAHSEIGRATSAFRSLETQVAARVNAAEKGVAQAQAQLAQVKKGPRSELLEQARRRLESALAAQDEAMRAHVRAEGLFEKGVIARATLEVAKARALAAQAAAAEAQSYLEMLAEGPTPEEVRSAEAAVESSRSQVRVAESGRADLPVLHRAIETARAALEQAEASVKFAKANLSKSVVRSPVDGFVNRIFAETGAIGSPLAAALSVVTREDIHIEAEISSEDAAKARVGMPLSVTSAAYPGTVFGAKLERLAAVGELKPDAAIRTRILRARVVLDEGWARFRPGMEVDVEGTTVLKRALSVPSDAIVVKGGKVFVYLVRNGKAEVREVKTGYSNMLKTEIVSGIQSGDEVVLRGKEALDDGVAVRVSE